MLDREPPLGRHQRGMIWCGACSRTLCWLGMPTAAVRRRALGPAAALGDPLVARRPVRTPQLQRTSGCGRTCSVTFGHDARAHETFGRDAAHAALKAAYSGVVRTGPLVVDFDAKRIVVAGAEVPASRHESGLLEHLAAHLGHACLYDDVVAAVWDATTAELLSWVPRPKERYHHLRVLVARTRAKLGPASALITTIPMIGLRLEAVDPIPALEAQYGD
jgi:DNA-binding winged helix-turn-helix (wHTH) protein